MCRKSSVAKDEHESGVSEGRELDSRRAFAPGEDGALDELLPPSIHAQVDLIQLPVTRLIHIALDSRSVTDGFSNGAGYASQAVESTVGSNPCILQHFEQVDLLLEVERCLEVGALVEKGLGASPVLPPFVAPEA